MKWDSLEDYINEKNQQQKKTKQNKNLETWLHRAFK